MTALSLSPADVGREFRTRLGKIVRVDEVDADEVPYPVWCGDVANFYTRDGHYYDSGRESPHDLIARADEPAPRGEEPVAWMPTDADMGSGFYAAKRVHVIAGNLESWWVGHGKDYSCQIEGTANHWFWLAYMMLGLVDEKDSPGAEDKPLPFSPAYVRAALAAYTHPPADNVRDQGEVVSDEMVERALDAYLDTETGWGGSMTSALSEAFCSVDQIEAARKAWEGVYDVEIHPDGSRTDNRNHAMRAALTAALAKFKEPGQ